MRRAARQRQRVEELPERERQAGVAVRLVDRRERLVERGADRRQVGGRGFRRDS